MEYAFDINIGVLIKKVIFEKKVSQAELARLLQTSPTQITRLLQKKSIGTDLLCKISEELDYNFFDAFSPHVYIMPEEVKVYLEETTRRRGFILTHPHIGNLISKRMKEIKVSQTELGRFLGISQDVVSRTLKNSSMDTERLVKISNYLNWNFFGTFYIWNFDEDMLEANKADNIMIKYLGSERVYLSGIDSITDMFADSSMDKFRHTIRNMFSLINILYTENEQLKTKILDLETKLGKIG